MTRKTDAELLEEVETIKKELKKPKKGGDEEYTAEPVEGGEEPTENPQIQVAEREINLSLINDKLNFIISKVQGLK